jgi:hypothetical protein
MHFQVPEMLGKFLISGASVCIPKQVSLHGVFSCDITKEIIFAIFILALEVFRN